MWKTLFSNSPKNVDQSTQKVLFKMFYSKVVQAAYYIVKDHALAEDIAQETFEKAFKRIYTLKDEAKAEAWFIQIAKRTAIDYLRKMNKERDIITVNDNNTLALL